VEKRRYAVKLLEDQSQGDVQENKEILLIRGVGIEFYNRFYELL